MKSRALIYILLSMAFSIKLQAQNLVPNYSFENMIKCIQGFNQFTGYVDNWSGGSSGLCYFTSVCNENTDSVPLNWWGYQYAHTGKAYAGIYLYVSDSCSTCSLSSKNDRDYMQDSLSTNLLASTRYYVTFFVSAADTSWYYCSDIGAYFSDSALYYPTGIAHAKSYLTPQVANNPVKNSLTKAKAWIKVSGSFIAKGGEKYIIIGNFKTDSASSIIYKGEVSTTEPDAFYYIDDVIVSPDSNYADSIEGIAQLTVNSEKVKVWPNPSDGKFTIESTVGSGKSSVEIYNMLGEKVYSETLRQAQGDNIINLQSQPDGLYLYRVISEKGELIGSGKLIIQ
jgi:OOP family OmpA-OmpF porin